ncbi:MAG: citrate synthase [Candidatus Sumerlaeota bacterium]|nr:citrate synthase [Candidatus Sumerlaeota bacterium]
MSTAKLVLGGKEHELPVVTGSEGEVGIDIASLRNATSAITLDPGYGNTGSCRSAVTFIDGEKGILRYRGYPIEELAEKATFEEICHLLVYGELPNRKELARFKEGLAKHSIVHEGLRKILETYPRATHPMAILSSMICSMSAFYPWETEEDEQNNALLLMTKMKSIAAFTYKQAKGEPWIYPRTDLGYASDFLQMMFTVPNRPYAITPVQERALDLLLVLHGDHEQNCSTSTVRMVGSSQANLFASISAGVCALWGPLHGGANEEVIHMLQHIHDEHGDYRKTIAMAKDKKSGFRLMGFGHRVYKNFDPRAKIIKKAADDLLAEMGVKDPLLSIAKDLEEAALQDEYFLERKLYPNVDFYSGIIYRALGIPMNMFTVLFAMGRLPGWIAHWMEMRKESGGRIHRPRQIYTGQTQRRVPALDERK